MQVKPHQPKPKKRGRKAKPSVYNPLADHFNVALSYDVRTQVSGSTYNVYNFDMLDIFTLQPYFRDQLFTIWQKAVVLGVTVTSKIVNLSTTVDAEVLSYFGSGTTVSALTFSQALEYKTTRRRLLTTSGNGKTVTETRHVDIRKLTANKEFWTDSDFWQTSSAKSAYSTSSDAYQFATGFFSANGTASISLMLDRRITFHVRFFNLAAPSNSLVFPQEKPKLQSSSREGGVVPTQKQSKKKREKSVSSDSA